MDFPRIRPDAPRTRRKPKDNWLRRLWFRLRTIVEDRILGLHDTPHRIAWGVFWGFVMAFTPTIGFQMVIFVAVATLLRANKLSGLPIVWITNPLTALPLYYSSWRVGAFLLGSNDDPERGRRMIQRLVGVDTSWSWRRLIEADFYQELVATFWVLGGELWLGGVVVGAILGGIFYPLTVRGVLAVRRIRAARELESESSTP